MTLVSGDLFITSLNIIFIRFHVRRVSLFLDIYLFHYLFLLRHWYTSSSSGLSIFALASGRLRDICNA